MRFALGGSGSVFTTHTQVPYGPMLITYVIKGLHLHIYIYIYIHEYIYIYIYIYICVCVCTSLGRGSSKQERATPHLEQLGK